MRLLRRYFWRLPLFLRVLGIVGFLCTLTAFALPPCVLLVHLFFVGWLSFVHVLGNLDPMLFIAWNLASLGWACSLVVNLYSLRFVQADRETFPLSSWQRQMGALVLLAATPLCGIAVSLVIPLAYPESFLIPGTIIVLGTIVLLAFNRRTIDGTANEGPLRTPRPQ